MLIFKELILCAQYNKNQNDQIQIITTTNNTNHSNLNQFVKNNHVDSKKLLPILVMICTKQCLGKNTKELIKKK